MAERPKISIKPSAPARDPHRPRVRGVASPRPAPAPRAPRPEATPPLQNERREMRPSRPETRPETRPEPPPSLRPAAPRIISAPPSVAAQRAATSAGAAATGVRVSKLITERGLASRREADDWIAAGWVSVGGRPVELGQRVAPDAVINIDPRARDEQARQVTVLLHKPMGIVSGQPEDGYEPAITLVTPANRWAGDNSGIEYRSTHLRHLAPAGRLDIDSTGLLVFTQDGRVAKRLIGDQTRVEKEYLVRVAFGQPGHPDTSSPSTRFPEEGLARLRQGLTLDGILLRPAAVSWQNEDQLRMVLREGRKRQIRRMCEQVGLEVLGLKRVRIGSVPLGQLPPGQWRYLRDDERF